MKIQLTNAANWTSHVDVPTPLADGTVGVATYSLPPKSVSTIIEAADGHDMNLPPRVTMEVLYSAPPAREPSEQEPDMDALEDDIDDVADVIPEDDLDADEREWEEDAPRPEWYSAYRATRKDGADDGDEPDDEQPEVDEEDHGWV